MLTLIAVLVALGAPTLAAADEGPAVAGRDAVSGVVRFDPHLVATPPGPLQAVPQVITNVDTTSNPAAQNETSIDISPLDSSVRVIGVNDYRTAANGDVNCGFAHSSDGGATWASGIIRGITRNNGGPFNYDAAGDPSVYFADDGSVYFACLAFDRSSIRSAIVIAKSVDGGATWGTPVAIAQSNTINLFHDKDMLTIDNSPASPFHGQLYVEWTEFLNNFSTSRVVMSHSSDGGATWSAPVILSSGFSAVEGAAPAVGPDGTVYAAWCSGPTFCDTGTATSTIYVQKSTDGGVTWSAPVAALTFRSLPATLPGNSFRVNSFPSIGVNPTNGAVYVVNAGLAGGSANVTFVASTDGGLTWSAPIILRGAADDQFFPWLRVSPTGKIWVCYYDQHWNTTNFLDVSCASSTTGTSFALGKRATTLSSNPANDGFGGTFIGDYIGLAIDSNGVAHAAWTDTRTGNADAWTNN